MPIVASKPTLKKNFQFKLLAIFSQPLIFLLIALLFLPLDSYARHDQVNIFVSILPQKYLAERIGQELISVTSMIDVGQNPVTYQPTPKQMSLLSTCDAYLTIGVPYESVWMDKIQNMYTNLKFFQTNKNITLKASRTQHHNHDEIDPHIWTNPIELKKLSAQIARALISIDPANKPRYENNLNILVTEFNQLDQKIKNLLDKNSITNFMVYHPAWGHYANHYGLKQIAIESHGKEPGVKKLLELIDIAKKEHINTIYVQSKFQQQSANIVAKAINAKIMVINPLAENIPANLIKFTHQLIDNHAKNRRTDNNV